MRGNGKMESIEDENQSEKDFPKPVFKTRSSIYSGRVTCVICFESCLKKIRSPVTFRLSEIRIVSKRLLKGGPSKIMNLKSVFVS